MNPYFLIGGTEVVVGTGVSGNTLTYTMRGLLGTTATTHNSGETIQQYVGQATGANGGPYSSMTTDITMRRVQNFRPANGATVTCTITPFGGSPTMQTPTVANGLWTSDQGDNQFNGEYQRFMQLI